MKHMNNPSVGIVLAEVDQSRQNLTSTPVRKTRKKINTLLKVLTSDYKMMKKENKSINKTIMSQHQVITELRRLCEELKQSVAQQSITFADQNTRVDVVENHLMNIYSREMMDILVRRGGSRSGSNQNGPNQTSAFM